MKKVGNTIKMINKKNIQLFVYPVLLLLFFTSLQGSKNIGNKEFQAFASIFPEQYLPFSISENELVNLNKSNLVQLPEQYSHFFKNPGFSDASTIYAFASLPLDSGMLMTFHLVEILYPLNRQIYATVFSKEGLPISSVLFASYEDSINETYTYAVINMQKIIHRTEKCFENSTKKITIKTEKFRINTKGEIVAL